MRDWRLVHPTISNPQSLFTMDIGAIFLQAVELVWRRKFLWLLGLLMGINGLMFSLMRVFLRSLLPEQWFDAEQWLTFLQTGNIPLPTLNWEAADLWPLLISGSVALFVYVVVFWLVVTVAEGAVIGAVNVEAESRPSTLSHSIHLGISYLKRFAAIDAAVFLPLFIWMLILLLLAVLDTITVGYMTLQTDTEPRTAMTVFALGWLCVLSLSCFIIPITLVSIWYRTLAFRDAAVLDHGVRQAMKHTRQVIRQHAGELIALTVILYGLGTVLNWVFGLLSLPLLALTAVPLAAGLTSFGGFVAAALNLTMTLLVALLKGMVAAFTAVVWTLAYREMTINHDL
ncbi:MAG: hypothetical protein GY796_36285 [Chloroflexi bacterium]|nr:hypothetical protein [Chloroflexota bacterium]